MTEAGTGRTPKLYERRLIAFLDILGWSEAVKNESPRLAAATEAIHEIAASHSRTEKDGILADPRLAPNPLFMAIEVGAFSDNIAISMPESFGPRILNATAQICRKLLHLGFLTRGGITVGELHHRDNVIFGPALTDAVLLEKEAIYPRIVCTPELMESFARLWPQWDLTNAILVDRLGRQVLHLFRIGANLPGKSVMDLTDEAWGIRDIRDQVRAEHARVSTLGNEKITEKWFYMRMLLDQMIENLEP